MSPHKLTAQQRREMVLSALQGANRSKLAEEYGVARSWLYQLIAEAMINQADKIAEAEAELEFRLAVRRLAKEERKG